MPQGDKRKYTDKQKRQAEHIEEGYEARGLSEDEAERRAWATVNAVHGGGEKPGGSGYGKRENREPMRRGGRKGGRAAAGRKRTARTSSTSTRSSSKRASAKRTTSSRKKTSAARKGVGAKKR
jgi:plasmid stabilization system protein ParE